MSVTPTIESLPEPGLLREDLIPDHRLEDPNKDLLNHNALVEQLARLVTEADDSVNIALYGPWGSGKSSVGRLLEQRLARHATATPLARFVRYDAWRYAGVSLQRSFITEAARQLGLRGADYHEALYQERRTSRVSGRRLIRALPAAAMVFPVLLAFCLAVMIALAAGVSIVTPRSAIGEIAHQLPVLLPAATVVSLFTAVLRPFLDAGVMQSAEAAPSAAEQFRRTFELLINDALARARRERGGTFVETADARRDRVVFFIDELDRCSAEEVVEALRALKTFLEADHCVFVVAADRDVIESALERLPQATPVNEETPYYSTAGAFLDKVFQYQIALPPLRGRTLTRFARDLVERRGGLWADLRNLQDGGRTLDEVAYALIPAHVRSPRRVKVLLNRFAANMRIAQASGLKWLDRAQEIAKLTALETEFPELAADLRRVPALPTYLLSPPDEPSPLATQLLTRHGWENGARGPARLLAGDGDARILAAQRSELRRYLERAQKVPDPHRDLLYREAAGRAVDLDYAELAEAIEELAGERPDEVLARLALCEPAERRKAALMLADLAENAVGKSERHNVMLVLLRALEGLGREDAAPVAWRAASAVRMYSRWGRELPQGLVAAALEAAEWSQPPGLQRESSLTDALLREEELWRTPQAVRRVALLAETLDLRDTQQRLAAALDRWPEELLTAIAVLTPDGVARLLALDDVQDMLHARLEAPRAGAAGPTGAEFADALYRAGLHTQTCSTATPLLLGRDSPQAYAAVARGARSGDTPYPGTDAAHNTLALLALRQAPPADWQLWSDRIKPLGRAATDEVARAVDALARVFHAFGRAKAAEQTAAAGLVTRLATFAGGVLHEPGRAAVTEALSAALAPHWWRNARRRGAHGRLFAAAVELRRAAPDGPFVDEVDALLVADLEAALAEWLDDKQRDEVRRLASLLPDVVGGAVIERLGEERWVRAGPWRDFLLESGADPATLDALYAYVVAADPAAMERLATAFARDEKAPPAEEAVAVAVRLAALVPGAAHFAVGLIDSQGSTAPDTIERVYRRVADSGWQAPEAVRAAVEAAGPATPPPVLGTTTSTGLRVLRPVDLPATQLTTDVVVIGSGAGGSAAAARLARGGRTVLVLERGPLIDPGDVSVRGEPLVRAAEEPLSVGDLHVFRGACVGGPTLFGRGIAVDPPADVLDHWDKAAGGALDAARLGEAASRLRKDLGAGPWDVPQSRLLGTAPFTPDRLSVLHHMLPEAQAAAPGALQVLADCRVERLIERGGRVTELECQLGDGRTLHVGAETVVLAAGALDTSALLRASGIGGDRVGTGIGFNVSAALAIESTGDPSGVGSYILGRGFAVEFGSDAAVLAVVGLPTSFVDYAVRAGSDPRWTVATVTVPVAPKGAVAGQLVPPEAMDRARLADAVAEVATTELAEGAERVIVAAPRRLDLRPGQGTEALVERLAGGKSMSLITTEPQGGNPIGSDPLTGVVGRSLRVHGVANLHVCDASVFPTPLGVYSQLTVMALAEMAADDILHGEPAAPPAPPSPRPRRLRRAQ